MLIARKWSTFLCKNVNAVLVSFVALLNIFTSSESDDFFLQGPQKEEKPVVVPGRRKEHKVGKIHFVEHRTALHLYHSFHRLWIFFLCMLQVQSLSLQLNIEMLLETDVFAQNRRLVPLLLCAGCLLNVSSYSNILDGCELSMLCKDYLTPEELCLSSFFCHSNK